MKLEKFPDQFFPEKLLETWRFIEIYIIILETISQSFFGIIKLRQTSSNVTFTLTLDPFFEKKRRFLVAGKYFLHK